MENNETLNLLNTKAIDLTVKEVAIVALAVPVIMIGGKIVVAAALTVKEKITLRFKTVETVVVPVEDPKKK